MIRILVALRGGNTCELLAERLDGIRRIGDLLEVDAQGSATLYVPAGQVTAVIPLEHT